jgi:hypothetical protein
VVASTRLADYTANVEVVVQGLAVVFILGTVTALGLVTQ